MQINAKDVVVPLMTALITVAGTVFVSHYGWIGKSRDQDIKMVELGIGILKADPRESDQTSPAREWAIRIVERYSGESFSKDDRTKLLERSIASGSMVGVLDGLGYKRMTPSPNTFKFLLANDEAFAKQLAAHNRQCDKDAGCEK
ncbi:hypothetical protein [Roseibium aggregatum]|uniref:hypothetical protein n=1 Tax=Roseibium aggregatum TaxID=187304 RepID=UPI001E457D8F|nr:hypothetical protein [Roseibium aggregatum]UES40923.1 hypothetical protein GFC08_25560 [Roseibium aggregatum]